LLGDFQSVHSIDPLPASEDQIFYQINQAPDAQT
jgi:hypothetical protein